MKKFLQVVTALVMVVLATTKLSAADENLKWIDCKTLTLEGQGWKDVKNYYDRLPAHAEGVVRPAVWNLGQQASGLLYRFKTTSKTLKIRWTVTSAERIALPHVPATMVSGVDIYGKLDGRWVYVRSQVRPTGVENITSCYVRQYSELMVYLPLYNGVSKIELGIEPNATITDNYQARKKVVIYGSSITQGAAASRPGMSYTAIVGRKLDIEVINLGFSGNGKMESELSDLLCELDPDCFVIDSLWNISADEARVRYEPFIRKLAAKYPTKPILLVENCNVHDQRIEKGQVAFDIYTKLEAEKIGNLYFLPNKGMQGSDGEATVDGTHPTDLGMMRMAEVVAPKLEEVLNANK